MRIRFTRPAPGWAYAEGMCVTLPEDKAKALMEAGYAVPCEGEAVETDLPDGFPARELLLREGLYTKEKVKAAFPVLHEIRGIGSKTVQEIKERLNK